MKKYLIFLLILILCFSLSLSVSAESEEDDASADYLTGVFEIGDEVYYRCEITYTYRGTEYHLRTDMSSFITESNKTMCLYYQDYTVSSSGKCLNEMGTPSSTEYLYQDNINDGSIYTNQSCINVQPLMYTDTSMYESCNDVYFTTNLPIFESYEDAVAYRNGELGIEKAVNYKKVFENGSWVSPFEDIEINDNDMPVPSLSNLSHNGFKVTNRAEEYAVDVYVVSGLRQPGEFVHNVSLDLSDYLYGHTLGWLTNVDKAYSQDSFDLVKDFGVDNVSLLNESVNSFYTEYQNAKAYYPDANFLTKVYYDVWGEPFGTTYFSYNDVTNVTASDLMGVDCYDIPLCFTCYKVRFYYFDETDGMHYGPWAVVTYCSNGDIKASTSYVGSDGNVIDTPTDFGKQDDQGNISYDNNNNSNFIDLNDTNSLFGSLRSIFNNMAATNNTFSQLFGSVFNFLPPEILAIIFGGIAAMVFIGIIKAIVG